MNNEVIRSFVCRNTNSGCEYVSDVIREKTEDCPQRGEGFLVPPRMVDLLGNINYVSRLKFNYTNSYECGRIPSLCKKSRSRSLGVKTLWPGKHSWCLSGDTKTLINCGKHFPWWSDDSPRFPGNARIVVPQHNMYPGPRVTSVCCNRDAKKCV